MASELPLAVLVSGSPGSGKTTLSATLSRALDLPHLNKDSMVHGIWRTRRRAFELGAAGVEPFYATMELWLSWGVSFVGDQTFVRGISEPDIAARLAPHSVLFNVHCRSGDSPARWEQRMRTEPFCDEQRLAKLRPLVATLQDELLEPLDFDCERIVVDTTDGYAPEVDDIGERIDGLYGRPVVHDLDKSP